MRTEQLRYLVDVAETKSMSKTAERLFVSPQAVSKSIKQLEQELDVQLMVRTSIGVELTKVGESIVQLAENMLKEEAQMGRIVAESKQRMHEDRALPIRICSISAIANIVLPELIARFSHMGIKIIPRIYYVATVGDVFEHLENNLCDLGLITYNEEELFHKFAQYQHVLDMDFLARDEQVVVMDQHLYQPGKEFVTPEELIGSFCTMFSLVPVEERLADANETHVMRSNDAEFHRAMIKKADAYVLMPRLAYQHFFGGKSYVALPLAGQETPMLHAAVYRKNASEDLRKFAALIRIGLQ